MWEVVTLCVTYYIKSFFLCSPLSHSCLFYFFIFAKIVILVYWCTRRSDLAFLLSFASIKVMGYSYGRFQAIWMVKFRHYHWISILTSTRQHSSLTPLLISPHRNTLWRLQPTKEDLKAHFLNSPSIWTIFNYFRHQPGWAIPWACHSHTASMLALHFPDVSQSQSPYLLLIPKNSCNVIKFYLFFIIFLPVTFCKQLFNWHTFLF